MPDKEYDEYDLWRELNGCPECDGSGVIDDDGYGDRTCGHCDGSGIRLDADEYEGDLPI